MGEPKVDPVKPTVQVVTKPANQASLSANTAQQIPLPQGLPPSPASAQYKKSEARMTEAATKAQLAENKSRVDIIQKLRKVIIDARQFRVDWGFTDSATHVYSPVFDAGGGAQAGMANAKEMAGRAEQGLDQAGQFLKEAEAALKKGDIQGYQKALESARIKIRTGLSTQSQAAESLALKDEQKATWARFHRDAAIDIATSIGTGGGGVVAKGALKIGFKAFQAKIAQKLAPKLGEAVAGKVATVLGNRFSVLMADQAIVNSPKFATTLQDALLKGKSVDEAVKEAAGRYAFDTITGLAIGEGLGFTGRAILGNQKVQAFMKSLEQKLPQGVGKKMTDWVSDRLEQQFQKFGEWREKAQVAKFLNEMLQHVKDVKKLVPSALTHDSDKFTQEMYKVLSKDLSLDALTEQLAKNPSLRERMGEQFADGIKKLGLRNCTAQQLREMADLVKQHGVKNADRLAAKLKEAAALKVAMEAHQLGNLHHRIYDACKAGKFSTMEELRAALGPNISENDLLESGVDMINAWRQARGYNTTWTWNEIKAAVENVRRDSPLLANKLDEAITMQRLAERAGEVAPWAENLLYYRIRSSWAANTTELMNTIGIPPKQ